MLTFFVICNIFLCCSIFLQVCAVYICYGAEMVNPTFVIRTRTWPLQWTMECFVFPPFSFSVFVVSLYVNGTQRTCDCFTPLSWHCIMLLYSSCKQHTGGGDNPLFIYSVLESVSVFVVRSGISDKQGTGVYKYTQCV